MRVDGALNIGGARESSATGRAGAAPKDEFLRLLVAQLRNQNPLEPQDGAAFVAQLAQFASLEQMTETNERLATLEAGQSSQLRAGFSNLVGRRVSVAGDTLSLPASDAVEHGFDLGASASAVKVVVYDASGKEVRQLELGPREAGRHLIQWDGLDADGQALGPGEYRFSVEAVDAQGGSLEAKSLLHAKIDGIDFTGGVVRFRIGERVFSPGDILSIDS